MLLVSSNKNEYYSLKQVSHSNNTLHSLDSTYADVGDIINRLELAVAAVSVLVGRNCSGSVRCGIGGTGLRKDADGTRHSSS